MRDIRKRKYFIYAVIGAVLLSFIHLASEGIDAAASDFLSDRFGADNLYGTFPSGIEVSDPSFGSNAAAEKLTEPELTETLTYQLPEDHYSINAGRAETGDAAAGEARSGRHHGLRFLAVIFLMVLLSCALLRAVAIYFGSCAIRLWQNIYYIHRVDGKKGKRFSVVIG